MELKVEFYNVYHTHDIQIFVHGFYTVHYVAASFMGNEILYCDFFLYKQSHETARINCNPEIKKIAKEIIENIN